MNLVAAGCVTVLFAATVFDDCGNGFSQPQPMAPSQPATKPCCLTDPPEGCLAACDAAGQVTFTQQCSGIAAGPRTTQFDQDVTNEVAMLVMQGIPVCSPNTMDGMMDSTLMLGDRVSPCNDGLPPVEWPNQDHDDCAPMAAGVCVTSW